MPSNYDRAYKSIDDSLERLGLDYIDLMLIHQSGSNDTEVYKALCQGVRDGKLRSIGISNYYTLDEYERVTSVASVAAKQGTQTSLLIGKKTVFCQRVELNATPSFFILRLLFCVYQQQLAQV